MQPDPKNAAAVAPRRPKLGYRKPAILAMLSIALLAGGSIAWAQMSSIAGAVIAPGSVIVEGKPKSIQHLDGGIVKAIHVDQGDIVEAGQILIELDETVTAANLGIYRARLADSFAVRERLRAELANEDDFSFPVDAERYFAADELDDEFTQQRLLMKTRHETRTSLMAQFDEKIRQFENQIVGVNNLVGHKQRQADALDEERVAITSLVEQRFVARSQQLAINRTVDDMLGQIAEHRAEVARITNSIAETKLSKLQADSEFREKTVSDFEEVDARISELKQQIDAVSRQHERIAIRAPVAGRVHELNAHTIGGIIQPAQTVMQIIPSTDRFEVELSVDPQKVDEVFAGQGVTVRFPAFHQRTTPELQGTIADVSPTTVVDERSGAAFYRAKVTIAPEEMHRLGDSKVIPGMPVEGFIRTTDRTVLSFLVKPLTDNLTHAFREE